MDYAVAKTTRFVRLMALTLSVFVLSASVADASPTKRKPQGNPRYAAITIDAQSGRILAQSNPHKSLYPASLTKMMTLFLAFEALDKGKLHPNKFLTVSRRAVNQQPSKLGLRVGEPITVKQGILALVTRSANDVAVAMAETIGGSEAGFVRMMNDRARSLGMKNTVFHNPHGLPNARQRSTVYDMAILARALMQYYPHHYHYFHTTRFVYKGKVIESHNNLMKRYRGMDGLKTGYTIASGFNLAASAVRNNRRIITVVFGGRTARTRDDHVAAMMNQGFAMLDRGSAATQFASIMPTPKQNAPAAQRTASIAPAKQQPPAPRRQNVRQASWKPDGGNVRPLGAMNASYDPETANSRKWGIQVGAFASAALGLRALQTARSNLGDTIHASARAIVVPQRMRNGGVIYRARILDLTAQNAAQACAVLNDCMAFTVRK